MNNKLKITFVKISSLLLLFLISGTVYCQGPELRIKSKQLNEVKDNTQKVIILNEIGSLFLNTQTDSTIKYANEALKLSLQINFPEGTEKAYYLLGKANYDKNNYSESLKNYNKVFDNFIKTKKTDLIAKAYFDAGMCSYDMGDYNQAKKYFSHARDISSELKLDTLYIRSSLWKGITLSVIGEIKEALNYHFEVLNLAEKIGLIKYAASATLEIGIAYSTMRNPEKAIEYYHKAVRLYKEANDQVNLSATLSNLSNEYINLGRYNDAIQYTTQALKIAEEINDKIEIGTQEGVLCRLYTALKQYSKAVDFGLNAIKNLQATGEKKRLIAAYLNIGDLFVKLNNPRKAIVYLTEALKLAREIKTEEELRICYVYLSQAYEAAGDYKNSLTYSKLFNVISDSIFNKENSMQIVELQTKYESEKKEKENELLKIEGELQKQVITKQYTVISVVGFGLLLMGAMVFILVRLNSQKKKLNILLNNQKDQLEQYSARLKELNITKDKFFSIIAHDLKNPFHVLNGIMNMLSEQDSDLKAEEKSTLYDVMKKTVDTSRNLLENLLQWANSQTGRIELKPENIQLIDLVNKNLTLFKGSFSEKNLNINVELDENQTIIADSNMVDTIIRNILSNAIKYTSDNGQITIKSVQENNEVKISIQDSGIGISEENIKFLFQMDKVFSTRGTRDEKGSGLGLLVCKEFVEKHNGKIWAESKLGSGSIFYIILPKTQVFPK
jgi:signal transduction histidine kinase